MDWIWDNGELYLAGDWLTQSVPYRATAGDQRDAWSGGYSGTAE
ncbi:hypothetical protein ACBQ88_10645 [Citrobacter braakii]